MSNPEFCVLKTDGINCDEESKFALERSGANAEIVHVNQLVQGDRKLTDYQGLLIPGGFSYGDDIVSGKVLAVELISRLSDQIQDMVDRGRPIMGICNGFQVLVRTGLLPNREIGKQKVTLDQNEVGHFICRWVDLKLGETACRFIKPADFSEPLIPMQIAHGEGLFTSNDETIGQLQANKQVVFRYDDNPNGSVDDIAGICDETGLILGMMPHPERSIAAFHPHRVRTEMARQAATTIFNNIVNYTKES